MKTVLVADEERDTMQMQLNELYLELPELPFKLKIVTNVDDAIHEFSRIPYELILSCEFLPDPMAGMLAHV